MMCSLSQQGIVDTLYSPGISMMWSPCQQGVVDNLYRATRACMVFVAGFRPGRLINLVQNFPSETLVVPGVANNTDVYAAYLGESTLADCLAVKQTPVATLSKVLELAKDYIMFE